MIGIDLAFDSIGHNLLLVKLKAYGVHDSAIRLHDSVLSIRISGRFQRVKCNGSVRLAASSLWGAAREPLIGPLFFNVFANDIIYSTGSSSLRLYADDTTQYIAHKSPCTRETTLNQDMERLAH